MQRQSLGGGGSSPGSKHHHNINHGVSSSSVNKLVDDEEEESKEETTTTTRKEKRGGGGVLVVVSEIEAEEKKKTEKHRHHHHLRSSSISSSAAAARTEKSIHLIPILMFFCLLILYLCSYDPPLKDLAHIDGFRRISSKRIDDSTTDGLAGRFSSDQLLVLLDDNDDQINNKAVGVGDVLLPLRSHRSLHEIRKDHGRRSIHRFHRKIGDYSTPHSTHSHS